MYANCANWCKCESPAKGLVLKTESYTQRLTQSRPCAWEDLRQQWPEPGCWPAVFVKTMVCWGCSVSRAQKTLLWSLLFKVFLVHREATSHALLTIWICNLVPRPRLLLRTTTKELEKRHPGNAVDGYNSVSKYTKWKIPLKFLMQYSTQRHLPSLYINTSYFI